MARTEGTYRWERLCSAKSGQRDSGGGAQLRARGAAGIRACCSTCVYVCAASDQGIRGRRRAGRFARMRLCCVRHCLHQRQSNAALQVRALYHGHGPSKRRCNGAQLTYGAGTATHRMQRVCAKVRAPRPAPERVHAARCPARPGSSPTAALGTVDSSAHARTNTQTTRMCACVQACVPLSCITTRQQIPT